MYGYDLDAFAKLRMDDLTREAENERLAKLAARPGRPVRVRIAEWLFAAAEWIEDRSEGSIVRAQAWPGSGGSLNA